MTNRDEDATTRALYVAFFKDAARAFPSLAKEFQRDKLKLLGALDSRGLRAVLSDLPKLCKHLDRCLDCGAYIPSGLPLSRPVSKGVVIPELFRGLYLRIFQSSGLLLKEPDIEAIFFLRQAYCLVKKVRLECPSEVVAATVRGFLQTDSALPRISRFWEAPTFEGATEIRSVGATAVSILQRTDAGKAFDRANPSFGSVVDSVYALICCSLGTYHPEEWRFSHGPGAVAHGGRFVDKYQWVSWDERLEQAYPVSEYGFYSYSSWAANVHLIGNNEEASRLIAVPKTVDKPRLIAAEPSSRQWCQQNAKHYFYERSEQCWISKFVRFRDQTLNQDLCRQGSLNGCLATLDLSEASDRVSCEHVEACFRFNPGLLLALAASRTQIVSLPGDESEMIVLRKYATMGNATTFPVESLVFLGIALAAALTCNGLTPSLENLARLEGQVAVFGDDIVVPGAAGELCVQGLEALGFKVNADKSFLGGNFRESCGVDAFQGKNVTPVSMRTLSVQSPDDVVSAVDTSNLFYSKWLLNVSDCLRRHIGDRKIANVHVNSGAFGYHCRTKPDDRHPCRYRWNSRLQLIEVSVRRPRASTKRAKTEGDSCLLQYFTERPDPFEKWSSGYNTNVRLHLVTQWVRAEDLYGSWLDRDH